MKELKINNVFGITPTTNCEAAGYDFYVPKFNNIENIDKVLDAWAKSYKYQRAELEQLLNAIVFHVSAAYGEEYIENNELNLLQLFLAVTYQVHVDCDSDALHDFVGMFVTENLIFDDNKLPGINIEALDHVFFNSGIKMKLETGTAGIFFNKSGRGCAGWDVRAQVVDEDYTGFVHLSLAFTSPFPEKSKIFCGDKITQMVILNVLHYNINEISDEDFAEITSKSKRGDNGFGSSNEKHN